MTFKEPPLESTRSFEEFRRAYPYSQETDVYEAVGFNSTFVQKVCNLTSAEVTALITNYIARADEKIRRLMGIPISVRKEGHEFFNNPVVELGPDREDPLEFFGAFDPTNKVEEIYAIYYNDYRTKIPYPKNWDQFTENTTGWGLDSQSSYDAPTISTAVTVMTKDASDFKCGTASLQIVFSGSGYIEKYKDGTPVFYNPITLAPQPWIGNYIYPSTKNLNRRIYPWFYIGFWFKSSDASATFQFRIVRDTGSYYYMNFNVRRPDTWEPIMLNIRLFKFINIGGEGSQPDFNWILTYTQYIEILSDTACTVHFDNFNFNDGFYASYPQGTIQWCMPEWYPTGRVQITYSYDPYHSASAGDGLPQALVEASSKLAGILLIDYAIGFRQQRIAFDQLSDSLEESPDRETLENTRRRLQTEAEYALETLGYRSFEGIG